MHSTRFTQLLLTALGLVSAVQSSGIRYNARGLMVRQDDDGDDSIIPTILPGIPDDGDDDDGDDGDVITSDLPGSSPSSPPAPTTSEVEPPTTTPPEETPTSTPEEDPSSTETPPEPTTSEGNDSPSTTSRDEPSSTSSSNDEPSSTSTNDDDEPSTTREPVVSTAIETVTRTNADGSETTMTSSTITTSTPHSGDDKNGGGGGLDASTRDIVIGVVVGVGGAILLGALGVVAWRIRNRKKAAEENDGLMGDYGEYNSGYGQMDKSEPPTSAAGTNPTSTTGTGRSPFQSTLENYHQPTQPVNASSNF